MTLRSERIECVGNDESEHVQVPESLLPAINLAKELSSPNGNYKIQHIKMVNFISGLVDKRYFGSKITIVDCVSQLSDKEVIDQATNGTVAWYSRQNDEITIILDNVQNVAQLACALSAANARLNFKTYLKNNNLTYEDFFRTKDYSAQLRAENSIATTMVSGATLDQKLVCAVTNLFRNKNRPKLLFSESERCVIFAELDKIREKRTPAGGYVRYKPIEGHEALGDNKV